METKEQSRTRIGFSRMEKKYEWKDHVIFMGILLATAVWVNRNIEIRFFNERLHCICPSDCIFNIISCSISNISYITVS